MATLEKIRSKSLLLLIIIGGALLAFIIGDFFTSSRTLFGPGTTVAKVAGQKIDIQEFQRRVQEASQQQQGRKYDSSMLQQQVLNQMIAEALFKQEAKDLGLVVTDNELREMMVGKNSGYLDQMVQQQLGVESAAQAHDMAYNPAKYQLDARQAQQLQQYWMGLETNMEQMLLNQKFQNLFNGTLVANDLDAKAMYEDNASTANVVFARKDYSTLDDDKYPVTDQEMQDAYQKDRNKYKLDMDTRAIEYIYVDIVPSAADLARAQQEVNDAIAALNEKDETTGLVGMDAFVVDRSKKSASDMEKDKDLKAFADSVAVGRAGLVSKRGNNYTLAKVMGRPTEIASATIDFMAVQGTRAQVDSLVRTLNAGASFDSIAAVQGGLVAQSQKDMEVSLLDPNYAMVREIIEGATVGTFFSPDTVAENGRIFRVTKRDAPAPVYDLAVVTYVVEPSAATVNQLQAKFQDFLNKNNDAKKFTDNAQAAGYTALLGMVTDNSAQIGNLSESHAGVAWAMDADKGEVSQIFGDEQTGKFFAVAVEDIYDEGFTPLRDTRVNKEIGDKVRKDHKAADLIARYKGKANDIDGYARLMAVQVDTAAVNFGQMMVPRLGMNESKVMGAVAAAKAGQLVGPVQGNRGVVVLKVNNVDRDKRPYNREEAQQRFQQQRGAQRMGNNITRILIGNNEMHNYINRFYK